MTPVLTTVWLTNTELDQVAKAVGDSFDMHGEDIDRAALDSVNAEIGMTKIRSGASKARAVLSKVMSCPNALMLNDAELDALLRLRIPDALRKKLTSGF